MLSSIHGRATLLSARCYPTLAYSSRRPKLRLVGFVLIAILLFPLIAFLIGRAALAQIYPAQTYPAQTYPAQTYPAQTYRAHTHRAPHRALLAQQQASEKKHNEGTVMMLGGYPGTSYFNLAHDMAGRAGREG
jgi:hypothetical protein